MKGLIFIMMIWLCIKVAELSSYIQSIDRRLDRLSEKILEDDHKIFKGR